MTLRNAVIAALTTKALLLLALTLGVIVSSNHARAFVTAPNKKNVAFCTRDSVVVNAIGVLARKAKEAEVRNYCQNAEAAVLTKLSEMKDGLQKLSDSRKAGPVQLALTKRKGTLAIIAEYRRKLDSKSGYIDDIFNPEILSPTFREFGASAIAIHADERIGGCTYHDIAAFVAEQEKARGEVPGPCPVLCNDLIVDEIQIARSAVYGAAALVINFGLLGNLDKVAHFIKCATALGMEAIVAVETKDEVKSAIEAGATMIMVLGSVAGVDAKVEVAADLLSSKDTNVNGGIVTIANILAKDNKQLEEVEEAWMCRDKGFNAVWVSDALYKGGNDPTEHAGAIIQSMKAKSSVKFASPKARSGKGEGAKEYLGDILM